MTNTIRLRLKFHYMQKKNYKFVSRRLSHQVMFTTSVLLAYLSVA